MYELTNDFHRTTARVRNIKFYRRTRNRIFRELCGMDDCQCGGEAGERGGIWQVVKSGVNENEYWLERR